MIETPESNTGSTITPWIDGTEGSATGVSRPEPGEPKYGDPGPIDGGGLEPLVEAAALSGDYLMGGDGSAADAGPVLVSFELDAIEIITIEATGDPEIPDQLVLSFAGGPQGQVLSITDPAHGGGVDNAYVWNLGDVVLGGNDPANTWADHGNDTVRFGIGDGNPFYEGSFVHELANGRGAGGDELGVRNHATGKAGGYWMSTEDDDVGDEVLSGLDAREDLEGGDGADIITLESVLTQADVHDVSFWLTADASRAHDTDTNTISSVENASVGGAVDPSGGEEINFLNIEEILYTDLG